MVNFLVLCKDYHHVFFSAVSQLYETDVSREYVILGNDAILKCKIPSFVSDFVTIDSWLDSENQIFYANNNGKKLKLVLWKKSQVLEENFWLFSLNSSLSLTLFATCFRLKRETFLVQVFIDFYLFSCGSTVQCILCTRGDYFWE